METIIIKPKNKKERDLLTSLLKKMNIEAHVLNEPFPNYETLHAIKDVESKKGNHVEDSNELFSQLGM